MARSPSPVTVAWVPVISLAVALIAVYLVFAEARGLWPWNADSATATPTTSPPEREETSEPPTDDPPPPFSEPAATSLPPAAPMTFEVALGELVGPSGYSATVGQQKFPAAVHGNGGHVEEVEVSTCTSITLTAGIDDDYGGSQNSATLLIQTEVGKGGPWSMEIGQGALTTATFNMLPGNFDLVFTGNPVIYVDGTMTCSTASGI